MNAAATQPLESELEQRRRAALDRAAIDASCRLPVLYFFGSSVCWLLVGTLLAMLSSLKLHDPDFLGDISWLTFGRVRPAHFNTMAYGWASLSGVGVLIWLMARLARTPLRQPNLLLLACFLWNCGVLVGAIGILIGHSTSIETLEFPAYAPPFFVAAYCIVGVCSILTFRARREPHIYVSQWYLFAAIFWFPWLYTVANLLMLYHPVRGVVQASVNWWYGHNVLGLWFTPIGLAAIYYLIPKVIGRPIYSYYMSIVAFWASALFYNWAGVHHLVGGPLPAWLITVGVVGSMMMLIPVGGVALNHHMTTVGNFQAVRNSPTLRFVVFGAMSYSAVSIQGSFEALRSVSEVAHFTHYTIAHAHLGLYGFYTMVMFGSMYYIVPRMTGWEWSSARLIRIHFWCAALGITLYFLALSWGGWFQGLMMNDPQVPFLDIVAYTLPYLRARTWAGVLLSIGHVVFAVLFCMNLLHWGRRGIGPTLLGRAKEADNPQATQNAAVLAGK